MAVDRRMQHARGTVPDQTALHQTATASSSVRPRSAHGTFVSLSLLRPFELVSELLTNHAHFWKLAGLLFLGEILLNTVIIKKIPYTEIDWIAYMQEVSGYLRGETDYMKLRGDTGPLVYPAGFVYIYSALYYLTDLGQNVLRGQWVFMGLYLMTLGVIFAIYSKDKSVRCHHTLAVSVKMNILLFFPAFGFLIWQTQGLLGTLLQLTTMTLIQIILSLPFTLHHAESYLRKAFEFSRVFEYKWTVNWKFLDEKTFLSPELSKLLLAGHFLVLFAFVFLRWSRSEGGIIPVILRGLTASKSVLRIHAQYMKPNHILTLMFTSNFLGIVFARSLHYQFYSWYSMTLPYLLWQTRLPVVGRILLLGAIEWSWNVFPATAKSSGVLMASHFVILVGLWVGKRVETGRRSRVRR
ncbi:dolichyl-P-Man:Man(5)GlcNAc(2)-PP-dolichol alpha-1,3-mannosyltransferase [Mortierella antarctica]|nr:dolichyl-P-Man:Man(5)GlcNAc(2)-PP-dolichol alpha-1,3-mannosyltransferase [Mortierella antarctica]